MNINIKINGEDVDFNLYDFQYWNQRLFCLGMSSDGSIETKFISTKGFDKLLMYSGKGSNKTGFHFKKEYFNPYTCDREKDAWTESQFLEKQGKEFRTEDVGPSDYNGIYEVCMDLGLYRDDLYFETKLFEVNGFDLYQYQNDNLYYQIYQSKNRDNEFPIIINQADCKVLGKAMIIHGVNEDGSKDFLDFASLYGICDADLNYPNVNSFYSIIRAIGSNSLLHIMKIGILDFVKWDEIKEFKTDCGFEYIKKNILHKIVKRKHCFRYLYEYYNLVSTLVLPRRKKSTKTQKGPKESKQFDFIPVFNFDEMMNIKIIFFKDIETIGRKKTLTRYVTGDSTFVINCFYNYVMGYINFEDFSISTELIKYVKQNLGIAESIRLGKILSIWCQPTFGYTPRQINLPIVTKANSHISINDKICSNVTIYSIPEYELDGEFHYTKTYMNLYSLLATFGLHISKVRNMLKMNEFSQIIFKDIDYTFSIYHICRDVRRGIFNWEDDKELSECMIEMKDALRLIRIFAEIGEKKNSFWYSNANNLFQSFPDTPTDSVSETYQPIGIKGYVAEIKNNFK